MTCSFEILLVFAVVDLDVQLVDMAMALVDSERVSLIDRATNNSQGDSEASATRLVQHVNRPYIR